MVTQNVASGDIAVKDGSTGDVVLTIPATPIGQPLQLDLGRGIPMSDADVPLKALGVGTQTISGFVYGVEG